MNKFKHYANLLLSCTIFVFFFFNTAFSFADTIIDNGDVQTSFTGVWNPSGGSEPFDPTDPIANSLYSRDGATYTWTFTPTDSGYHDVSMWWTQWPSRSSNIPVDIEHEGGTDRVFIDQQNNGGQWNLLSTYAFNAGESYRIVITSQPGPSSTCADAVQFVYRPEQNIAPVAEIDSITPNPASTNDSITFTGHGDDIDGSVTGYSWDSDLDGQLAVVDSFTTTDPLTAGTHTISFTVYDNNGEPSQAVTRQLVVRDTSAEVVIDNGDTETSFTGMWSVSGGANPWDPSDPGATSLWSRDGATYTWTFSPAMTGNFELSMWWTQWASRSNNIPVSVEYEGGTDSIVINQRINGGEWNRLGSYPFSAGGNYNITITSQPGPSSTSADAVKFVFAGGDINLPPVATIDVIAPSVAVPGNQISFTGSGHDDDGSVAAYEWTSDIDGLLSNQENFNTTLLSPGTHSIFFRARDDQGAWSAIATALVVVRDCDSPVAIMPLGNSITRGFGEISDSNLMTGYRAPLHQQLVSGGYNFDFVGNRTDGLFVAPSFDIHHQATSGITAASVAGNVYNWLVENPAEIVLLHIGTNDFTTNPTDVEDILNEIDRYEIDNGMDVVVVLARIINRQTNHPETTVFNDNLQAMAESRVVAGDKIVMVDQESALNYVTDMWDNLHPNNLGYPKMSGPWMDELIGLLPTCNTFKPFIYTTPRESASLDVEYTYQAIAIGRPAVTYNLSSAPSGMVINEATGDITWIPASGQGGSHIVSIQASNSVGVYIQDFTIELASETLVIDNGDPETSSTGTWNVSGGADPYDPVDPSATSLWSRDGSTYTWTFTPSVSGVYEVSMWWTTWPSRSAGVPVTIGYSGGTDSIVVNQKLNGGMWNVIGSGAYPFSAGVSYNVTITSPAGPSSTSADAVRFVKQ